MSSTNRNRGRLYAYLVGAFVVILLLALTLTISLRVFNVHQPQSQEPGQPSAGTTVGTTGGTAVGTTGGTAAVEHYVYVFPETHTIDVYDMDHGHRLVKTIALPSNVSFIRGVAASIPTHTLYIAYGGNGGSNGNGSLLAYDLVANHVIYDKHYPRGIDSFAITADGKAIYMPDGDLTDDGTWRVIDAATGNVTAAITTPGKLPHNTVMGPGQKHVYLGGRGANYLYVADTATNTVIQQIGPVKNGVRPFTINASETLAFITTSGFLGFQVGDIATGKILFTVPVNGFTYTGPDYFAPSHGVSLSPDEKELYLVDWPNSSVHVFDVSGLPSSPPKQVADIHLHSMSGNDIPCVKSCEKEGWVLHSRDGRFVYVGDAGDVVDTATRKSVAYLPPLANTRKMMEIDWQNGVPVFTTNRYGIGYGRST